MKRFFSVGYDCGDGIFSVNMITADGENAEAAARATAEKRAARYGNRLAYIRELQPWEAESNKRKGMPVYAADPIPDPDPSTTESTTESTTDKKETEAETMTENNTTTTAPEAAPETKASSAPAPAWKSSLILDIYPDMIRYKGGETGKARTVYGVRYEKLADGSARIVYESGWGRITLQPGHDCYIPAAVLAGAITEAEAFEIIEKRIAANVGLLVTDAAYLHNRPGKYIEPSRRGRTAAANTVKETAILADVLAVLIRNGARFDTGRALYNLHLVGRCADHADLAGVKKAVACCNTAADYIESMNKETEAETMTENKTTTAAAEAVQAEPVQAEPAADPAPVPALEALPAEIKAAADAAAAAARNGGHMDIYADITARIMAALERGVIPWRKGWTGGNQFRSWSTRRPYSFINQIYIAMQGGTPGEYITFNQAKNAGGTVKKGARGKYVTFWKQIKVIEKDINGDPILDDDGKPFEKMIPVLKYYTVFNAATDCDGVKLHETAPAATADPIPAAEAILAGYIQRSGVKFANEYGDRAFYRPATDSITVPELKQFTDPAEYYSTAFHECIHSTGHPSRLNRFDLDHLAAFGSETYSKEELTAECGAASVMAAAGLETPATFKNSAAAYIQGWLKALRDDKRMIVTAMSRAEKAARLILGEADPAETTTAEA